MLGVLLRLNSNSLREKLIFLAFYYLAVSSNEEEQWRQSQCEVWLMKLLVFIQDKTQYPLKN